MIKELSAGNALENSFDPRLKGISVSADHDVRDPLTGGDRIDRRVIFGEPLECRQQHAAFVAFCDRGDRVSRLSFRFAV